MLRETGAEARVHAVNGTDGPEQLDPKWSPAVRRALLRLGYSPTPTNGKAPVLPDWQNLHVTEADIAKWETTCPSARNTGILTARTPCVDIDVLDSEMAHKIHATLVAPLIGEGYPKLCRVGLPPKMAIPFRCEQPFPKIATPRYISENGIKHRVEVLGAGQQFVAFGIHPDTGRRYRWSGGVPWKTPWSSLPILTESAARKLIADVTALFQQRGWRPEKPEHPKESPRLRPANRSDGEAHEIAVALTERIVSLCQHLLPNGKRRGKEWCVGSINGETGDSLRVHLNGEKAGVWCDFANESDRGDALDLVEAIKNLSTIDAMDWARSWLGWPSKEKSSSGWRDESQANSDNEQQPPNAASAGSLANFVFINNEVPAPQKMLIEGVMPLEGLPFIGGQSSAGKTFIAILIAVCAARGKPFFGHEVKEQVGSVIVAAEGKGMLRARIAAAMKELGIEGDIPIAWVKQVPDFNHADGLQAFVRDLRTISEHFKIKFGVRLGLVFVDTVSASFDIKEEADNAEAARVCKVMRRIGDAIVALVVPIHHYGKNAAVGLRGASAWRANADFVLSVMADIDPQTGNVSNRQLAIAKDRDGAQGPLTSFTLKPVELGADESGQRWGSMVAVAEAGAAKPASDWPPNLSVFRQALQTALADGAFEDRPFLDGPLLRVVFHDHVRDEFAKITHVDSASEEKRREAIRKQFARKLADAQSKKLVGVRARSDGKTLIWLVSRQGPPQ